MGFLFSLMGLGSLRSKLIVMALVLGAAGAGGWVIKQKFDLAKAHEVAAVAQRERDNAVQQLDHAIAANKESEETIKQLKLEKKASEESYARLQEAKAKIQVSNNKLTAIIEAQKSNPLNQAPLSPVLREVVRGIQAERDTKTGAKPWVDALY